METRPRYTSLIEALPPTVPFVAPDALMRRTGKPLRVRLGANESAFGVSPCAAEAMRKAIDELPFYADPESHDLRARLAEIHHTSMDHVVVASGIDELLGMAVRCFVEPGQAVVASLGSYPTFAYHVKAFGGALHTVPYRDDHNDLQALAAEAEKTGAKILYLANPDNPSGTFLPAADVAKLVDRLPPGCTLILDEAYADFAPPGELLPPCAGDPRVIRMYTFSKAHGLAGARIGHAIAAKETILAFDKFRLHFGVNKVAQVGALASLADPGFVKDVVAAVEEGRREYAALGRELGLPTLPSFTNFVAFDIGSQPKARALLDRLLVEGVFIRMPYAPPLDRCVRVTVGRPEERAAFAETLRRLRAEGFV
jgi:histidinol-phosphate aminotransferase